MDCESGIYKILNLANGKIYVGSAFNLKKRESEHFHTLRNGTHHNYHLQKSFNKYGEKNFEFNIIEQIFDKSLILQREQYWIDFYKCYDAKIGYNICPTAGNMMGTHHTEASKLKNSISHKALHLCGEKSPLYGKEMSNETKLKIGKANAGEKNWSAILKMEQVKEIKFMIMDGYKNIDIAKKYGIDSTTIASIKKGHSWESVEIEGFSGNDISQMKNNSGVNNPTAKFTKEEIISIKTMISKGIKAKDIASIFNCGIKTISSIKRGDSYASVVVEGITQDYLRNKAALISPISKLTVDDVIKIKYMLRNRVLLQTEIALMFNVSTSCIGMMNRGKTYKNITIPEGYAPAIEVA